LIILGTRSAFSALSQVADGTRLWSHYAAEHRGFVIGFEQSSGFLNSPRAPQDDFFRARKVEYVQPSPFADLNELAQQNLLFAKSPKWADEEEWRMLFPVTMATRTIDVEGEPGYLVAFPPECVQCVIFGARASAAFESEIRKILEHPDYRHVSVHRARLDERTSSVVVDFDA
jgi:hypothetical protein